MTKSDFAEYLKQYGFLINSVIFAAGLVYTAIQLRLTRQARLESSYASVAAHNSDVLNRNSSDPHRKRAFLIYLGVSVPQEGITDAEFADAYLGARMMLSDLLNLAYQVWLVAPKQRWSRSPKLQPPFEGWEPIMSKLAREIYQTPPGRPEYYENSCKDLRNYLDSGRWYTAEFIKKLKESL